MALVKRIREVSSGPNMTINSSRMRDITDPLSWVFCYLSFVAAKNADLGSRDLLAYGQIIIELARKHAGLGWLLMTACSGSSSMQVIPLNGTS